MRALAIVSLLILPTAAGTAWAQSDPAADHYKAGVARFKAGQYPEAVQEFRAADAIRSSPVLSFNIAQCYEKMADLPNARAAYQDYLRRAPNADDRAAVEATLASIDQRLAQQQAHDTVVLVPSSSLDASLAASSGPKKNYALGAITTGVGVAGLAAAIILNSLSWQNSQSLQNDGVGGNYWSKSQAQSYHDNASNLWTGALVAYIAGGVITAVGGGLLGYELLSKPSPNPQ